jgi:hypothetical protein
MQPCELSRARTKQCSLRLAFPDEFLRSNKSLFEGDRAVFDFEGADTAIAIEPLLSSQLTCYIAPNVRSLTGSFSMKGEN